MFHWVKDVVLFPGAEQGKGAQQRPLHLPACMWPRGLCQRAGETASREGTCPYCLDLKNTESSLGGAEHTAPATRQRVAVCQVSGTASSQEAEGAEAVLDDFLEEGADGPAASHQAPSLAPKCPQQPCKGREQEDAGGWPRGT